MNKAELATELNVELECSADDKDAREIVDAVLGYAIAALRADRCVPSRTLAGWELFFADAATRAADELSWLNGLISARQAVNIIVDYLADRGQPENDDADGKRSEGASSDK
jgi:hypothetical protein